MAATDPSITIPPPQRWSGRQQFLGGLEVRTASGVQLVIDDSGVQVPAPAIIDGGTP